MNYLPDDVERLWTVRDTARFLRCSTSFIYKGVERGEIPHVRIGALVRFDPRVVRAHFLRPSLADPAAAAAAELCR